MDLGRGATYAGCSKDLIQSVPDSAHLLSLCGQAASVAGQRSEPQHEPVPDFTESRAKALLRAADLLDDPTRHSFERLMENETAVRVALYDLLAR